MRRLVLFFCFFSQSLIVLAQTWEAGVSVGASGYMGDINPVKFYKFTDPAFGALVKRNFNGYWSAKVGFTHGRIQADDSKSDNADQVNRNLSFRSDITELSLQMEFNFFNYLPGLLPGFGSKRLSPYIFTGISGFSYNPVTDYNGSEIELQPLQTEAVEYKRNAISIPYGAGVKYNIKGNWNVIGEIGYRTAFTDYLDDLSGRYPDFTVTPPVSPLSPALSDRSLTAADRRGQQRGDFRKRDTYMITAISLTYTFVPVKCPTF
ncbi:DUF6089 family protein [Daejeonella sp. JGW-45]|uniref:type IX secretion system protein PorG n=1 Tax=Daejeonella sp. JGW-45 TaxID=3034148 RepID=UPI0023EC4B15|nr:DUF6089 family protein [Daejeonella sp. JGW-45]